MREASAWVEVSAVFIVFAWGTAQIIWGRFLLTADF